MPQLQWFKIGEVGQAEYGTHAQAVGVCCVAAPPPTWETVVVISASLGSAAALEEYQVGL